MGRAVFDDMLMGRSKEIGFMRNSVSGTRCADEWKQKEALLTINAADAYSCLHVLMCPELNGHEACCYHWYGKTAASSIEAGTGDRL